MLRKLKNVFLAVSVISCLAFIACKQEPESMGEGTQTSLSLSESSITMTSVGETKKISASYNGSDTLLWSVEDTSVASVTVDDNLNATVKALKAGSTSLTVKETNGSLSASLKITNSISAQAVSDLKVIATDASSVTISWTAPEKFENFTVKTFSLNDEENPSEEILVKEDTTENSSYQLSELTANSSYKFYVYTNYGGIQSAAQNCTAKTSSVNISFEVEGNGFSSPAKAGSSITLIAKITDNSEVSLSTLQISEWTSSNTEIATVKADETNPNKATVTAVGPSGTANITAKIKNSIDDSELSSKSYSVSIVGAAVDVSSVAITVQSSAEDESLSDKQVKVSWNAPSYVDSYKVELYKQDETTADVSEDSITDTSVILKVSDYGTYFAKVYSVYGEDVSGGIQSQTAQVKDFLPCDEVEKIELNLSTETPSLSWTAPGTSSSSGSAGSESSANNSDFAGVNIYLDDEDAVKVTEGSSYSNSSLSGVKKIKITTLDTSNNESSGKTFTIYSSPSFENISVETGYTGQLVISNIDFDSTANSSITWSATSSIDGSAVILDTENSKIYVNGLTVGTEVSPSITFTAKSADCSVKYAALSTNQSVSPVMVVWKLKSWWPTDLPPAIVPHISDSVTAGNIVMANFAGASQTSDMMYADATYTAFIVHPGLTNTDGTSISLEATNFKGEASGLYVYADINGDVSWEDSYSNKENWNYQYSSKPQLYTVSKDSMTDTQKSEAVFYKVSSTSSFASNTENAVPAGYEGWFNIKSAVNNAYWYGSCFNVSLNSEIASNGDSDIAILSQTWSGSESSDNPTAITVESSVTDHSITLTWTEPDDVDFAYLEISSEGKLLDGTTSITTQEIPAGTQSATFEKLSANETYTFTVTEYDAFGNTTQVSTSAKTNEDTTAPGDVSGLTANVGRDNVTLSWTNPDDIDAKTVSIYQDDSTTAIKTISIDNLSSNAENENSAEIKNLSSGTEYTFKLVVSDYAGNASECAEGTTVKATPTAPSASNVTVSPEYSNSLLVSWKDTNASETDSDGNAITYTYKVECTSDSSIPSKIVDSGVQKALFTGLTVGTEYTFKVTVVDNNDKECGSVTTQATAAKTVIWKLLNGYDNRYVVQAINADNTESKHIAALAEDVDSYASYWIVRPALSGTEGYFSLEVAKNISGLGTGKFVYLDSNSTYSTYTGAWSYGGHSAPYAVATSLSDIGENKTRASFKWGTSSHNSDWYYMQSEFESRRVSHNSLTFWGQNRSSEDNDGCGDFKVSSISYADVDYTKDSPVAPENLTESSKTNTSFTVTWTDPEAADLAYVKIDYENSSDSSDAGSHSVSAGIQSATITGLTAGTTYSVKATAYDVYGNHSSTTSAISITTTQVTNVARNVNATARFTGEILVTWDRASDDTSSNWYYKVVPTDTDTDTNLTEYSSTRELSAYAGTYATAADGVAQFKGLTPGSSYTFTVYASSKGTTWNNDSGCTVSATAKTVTKKIISKSAETEKGTNNDELNTVGAANKLCCQYSTGGGTGDWKIYPALDGSITASHTVTTSSRENNGIYDTFSIYHTTKGYATLSVSALTESTATSLGTNVSCSTSTTSDSTGGSSFFFGYNSTDSCYTLRLNVSSANYALGYSGSDNNDTEILYYNDATTATCERTNYAWYFN